MEADDRGTAESKEDLNENVTENKRAPEENVKENERTSEENGRTAYHPAFEGVLYLETKAFAEHITIESEHRLSQEPVQMDFLVVKKDKGYVLDGDIFSLWRDHNVIEYKSPRDELNMDVLYKVIGYAGLYKGLAEHVGDVPADQLTISIFRDTKPEALFRELLDRGKTVECPFPGIYYVRGVIELPVQIVVMRELEGERHIPMRLLSPRATAEDIGRFLKYFSGLTDAADRRHARAVLQVCARINTDTIRHLKEEMKMEDVLWEIMRPEIEEKIGAAEKKARDEGRAEVRMDAVRNVMASFGVPLDRAMEALKIPPDQRKLYEAGLRN